MAALGMEYNWDPESKYARAALADKYMPSRYDVESVTTSWVPLSRRGDVDRWENKWSVNSDAPPSQILTHVEDAFSHSDYFTRVKNIKWTKEQDEKSREIGRSLWKFKDEQGNPWSGVASVDPVRGEKKAYIVSVKVERLK